MHYTKAKIGDSAEIKIDITDENVFCVCPGCGAEVQVDIMEFSDEDDLFGISVYCETCSEKLAAGKYPPKWGDSDG